MNDQSYLHPVSNTNQSPSRHAEQTAKSASTGQIKKRFRRGAARHLTSAEVMGPRAAPARGPSESPARFELAAPVSSKVYPSRPVRDIWNLLPQVAPDARKHFLPGAALVNFFRSDPGARAFDLLRTRLLQTLRANGWHRIAIAAPTQGCGSTFIAVNLAQSLARVAGSRTVLMDVNHRTPGIADMLGIKDAGDMRGFLSGDVPVENHLVRASETLALGLAARPEAGAAEILHAASCTDALERMFNTLNPGVVLYDLPPILEYDDMAAFLPRVDGVLLVVDGTKTPAGEIAACEKILDGQTQLLGIILNRARPGKGE